MFKNKIGAVDKKTTSLADKFVLYSEHLLKQNEPCVMQVIHLSGHCPIIPINYNKTSIAQLKNDSIIIIPALAENIHLECPSQDTIDTLALAKTKHNANLRLKIIITTHNKSIQLI